MAFTELAITGYPPEDLVLKAGFVADNLEALGKIAAHTGRCAAVIGYVAADRDLYNAAALCAKGEVLGTYRKRLLPNYAVFDEQRYFTTGTGPLIPVTIAGMSFGALSAQAKDALNKGKEIMARMTALSPDNAQWRKDLGWFEEQIAALEGK